MQWTFDIYTMWSEGLATLLRAGYSPTEETFYWAIATESDESVRLLISAQGVHLGLHALRAVSKSANSQTKRMLVNALAKRRVRLQHLAETHLPSDELGQLHIQPGCLLNSHAGTAYRMLVNHGVDVGFVEGPCWSVYAGIRHDLETADLLWEAGFRNMEELDRALGLPSTMSIPGDGTATQGILEFSHWLIAKGSDIHRRDEPQCNCPALHHVAYAAGMYLGVSHRRKCFSRVKAENIARMIFIDTSRNICDCPCSVGGCYPVTKLLQGLFEFAEPNPLSSLLRDYRGCTRPLYAFMNAGLEHSFETHTVAIIRAFTFEALGIPHTCEHAAAGDADEIDQWKDEIHTLEDLMVEHISVYEESGMSLLSFLEGHWLKRMREVLLMDQPPSHKQISSIRELGVILDETDLGEDEDCGRSCDL